MKLITNRSKIDYKATMMARKNELADDEQEHPYYEQIRLLRGIAENLEKAVERSGKDMAQATSMIAIAFQKQLEVIDAIKAKNEKPASDIPVIVAEDNSPQSWEFTVERDYNDKPNTIIAENNNKKWIFHIKQDSRGMIEKVIAEKEVIDDGSIF